MQLISLYKLIAAIPVYKRIGRLIAGCFIFFLSCKKNADTVPVNNKGDVVIGSYFGIVIPAGVNTTASVSKIATGQYRFSSNGNLPSFNFQFDTSAAAAVTTFFTSNSYYIIPAQNTGGAMLDSAKMTFYTNSNVLDVQLTDKTNNAMWNYGGKKQ